MERPIVLPSSPAPRVSILIVAARLPGHLARCLESIASCSTTTPFETIVVLNDATPEVRALVGERVSGVSVIRSSVPLGLAGALNRARAEARGELLVLLHDDSDPQPGCLDALVAVADSHPEAGAIGGRMLNTDGSPQYCGALLWSDGTSTLLGTEPEPETSEMRTTAVDFCGSSCLLVRVATWDAIGGADERYYPAYYVDADLCFSTWCLNQAVLCTTASRVRHERGGSTKVRFRHFVARRNQERFRQKWGSTLNVLEPRPTDLEAGVQRALVRADRRWRHAQPGANLSQSQPRIPFDISGQEQRAWQFALDLERDWAVAIERNGVRQMYWRLRWQASELYRRLTGLAGAKRSK